MQPMRRSEYDLVPSQPGKPRPSRMGFPVNDYGQEFMAAWNRTAHFGLALPPVRLLVRKDCIDLSKALPVIVEYFNRHSGEQLVGQTLAIHDQLQPELCAALGGVPLHLTTGWIEFNGTPRMQHGEELIQRFLTEKLAAWHREGVPFHLWLTSPALEVLDVTFALNLGWAKSAEECKTLPAGICSIPVY
jgi:hypothetical protein